MSDKSKQATINCPKCNALLGINMVTEYSEKSSDVSPSSNSECLKDRKIYDIFFRIERVETPVETPYHYE